MKKEGMTLEAAQKSPKKKIKFPFIDFEKNTFYSFNNKTFVQLAEHMFDMRDISNSNFVEYTVSKYRHPKYTSKTRADTFFYFTNFNS